MQSLSSLLISRSVSTDTPYSSVDNRYRLTRRRTALHRFANALPPSLRETFAEKWLRRANAPAPAAEHVFQYLRDARFRQNGGTATTAKGADNFYERQYRQYLSPVMGVFAMTARMSALAAGEPARGLLWARRRNVAVAMAETCCGAPPIVVLDHQTVAVALFLPRPERHEEAQSLAEWLAVRGSVPQSYRSLAEGRPTRCAEPGVLAKSRPAVGAIIETTEAALKSGRLALLALYPYDPDAMGLHITLFGVEALEPSIVEWDYALGVGALDLWRRSAVQTDTIVYFLVGGVEEAFTQCSKRLFGNSRVSVSADE